MCRDLRMQKPKKPKLPRKGQGYLCPKCRGCGYYYNSSDRDVIEGYKLAPRYKCKMCDETGILTKAAYMRVKGENFKVSMARYKKKLAEYNKKKKVALGALKKLTRLEINYLKTYWGVR